MLSNMKRYTDSLAILVPQCNLDVHFAPFHILAENPHLALLVQHVDDWAFHIVLRQEAFHNQLTLHLRNVQLQQSLSVLLPIIPKYYPEHLSLDVKLLQNALTSSIDIMNHLLFRQKYKQLFKYYQFFNDKVEKYYFDWNNIFFDCILKPSIGSRDVEC